MNEDAGAGVEPELNRGQVAAIFGVSENTIDKWRKKGMPVETEGGNGVSYGFLYSACDAWRGDELQAEASAKAASDDFVKQKRMEFLGLKKDDRKAALTPLQMQEWAKAELVWIQAGKARKELVQLEDMIGLVDGILTEVRAALDGFPDWLEREFALTPDQVLRGVTYCDGILQEMHDKIQAAHLGADAPVVDDLDRGLFND
jgi:phage terminase Nu1 subunit (DNA packaging protein)